MKSYFPTADIIPGEMVVFWDKFGIFMGLATDEEITQRIVDCTTYVGSPGGCINISFKFNGEIRK